MKPANSSAGNQLALSLLVHFLLYFYFDPINQMWHEVEMINTIIYLMILPAVFIVCSIITVFVVGLPVRLVTKLHNWWRPKRYFQIAGILIGLTILYFSTKYFLSTIEMTDANNEKTIVSLKNLPLSLTGWFITAFFLVHLYPAKRN